MYRKRSWSNVLLYILLGLLIVIMMFPLYWMLISSFRDRGTILDTDLIPSISTLDNYRQAFQDLPLAQMLFNTFAMVILQTTCQIIAAVGFGYALARWDFPGKRFMYFLMTLAWIVPTQAIMIPNYVQISEWKLNGTLIGMVLPSMVTVFANLQLLEAFNSFPHSLYEAAELDGSNSWQTLKNIVVPNLAPTIASVAIISFINGWNEYLWPLLVSTSNENATIQVGIRNYIGADVFEYGSLMAASFIACLPVLVIYTILQRQIMDNMVRGGIK